jgi:hypothetical protein
MPSLIDELREHVLLLMNEISQKEADLEDLKQKLSQVQTEYFKLIRNKNDRSKK